MAERYTTVTRANEMTMAMGRFLSETKRKVEVFNLKRSKMHRDSLFSVRREVA